VTDDAQPRTFPAPHSISEQARAWLSMQLPAQPYPALDDTEGWLQRIKASDEGLSMFLRPDLPVESEERDIEGVRTYVVRAPEVPDDASTPIYLDIHGGALISGGGDACRLMAAGSAVGSGMIHWAVDYRMPPLHPYPAPLDDCMTVYRRLLTERDPADIVVGGGSAGGNLAAALVARAKDEGLPMPAGLVLLTPEVDLTESGDSFTTNLGLDNILSGSLMPANLLYANGHDLAHPYLSPLFADVTGFPPTFVQAGTRDLFLSNAVRMHRKLRSAGVDAELHVFEAMPHGGFGGAPEDVEMRSEIRRFLDRLRRQPA
jgi:acetyl esterase/lipase